MWRPQASPCFFFLTYYPVHTADYTVCGFNVLSDWLCSLSHGINICIFNLYVRPFSKNLRFFLLSGKETFERKQKKINTKEMRFGKIILAGMKEHVQTT